MSVLNITKQNFEQEILKHEGDVLVDFWAPWCGPCKMLSPVIENVANELADVKVVKVNVDEQPELASAFRVMSIPTLVVLDKGKEIRRSVGYINANQVKSLFK